MLRSKRTLLNILCLSLGVISVAAFLPAAGRVGTSYTARTCSSRSQRWMPGVASTAENLGTPTQGAIGVIVCDHGSRRSSANEMLEEVAKRFEAISGFDIVEMAHMELAEPSISQAFDRCVAGGAERVILHPFFLSPGRHVLADIPALMGEAAAKHPGVEWTISEPLGLQEKMPLVMLSAVSNSIASGSWKRATE